MKNLMKLAALVLLTIGMSVNVDAQRNGQNGQRGNRQMVGQETGQRGNCAWLDLSDEQQEKVKALRTKHLSETQTLHNQLNEKHARLQTLRTAANPNMNTINSELEAIGKIKVELAQNREKHWQDVRALLNDEQRVMFDARQRGPKNGYGKGHGGHGKRGGACKGGW